MIISGTFQWESILLCDHCDDADSVRVADRSSDRILPLAPSPEPLRYLIISTRQLSDLSAQMASFLPRGLAPLVHIP